MNRKVMMRVAFAALAGGAMIGCAKDGKTAAAGANGNRIVIAMIGKSSTNAVFLAARSGAEATAKALSAKDTLDISIMWLTPPQEDGEVQAQRIRQAVNDGANAILLSASDAGKVNGAINDAVDRGVPVMMFDSDAPQSKRFAFYGADDAKTGQQAMAELATLMGGKGKVAILAGNQNAPNLQHRVQGAKDEAAKHPDMKVVGVFNHVESPQDAAAEVIRANNAYPEIRGWAFIGGWPLFSQSLLTDIDTTKQKIASVDAMPEELAYVARGVVPVLLAQPVYKWGEVGVQTIVDKLHYKKDPAQPVMTMELVRVTKANLGEWARQLSAWGIAGVDSTYLKM